MNGSSTDPLRALVAVRPNAAARAEWIRGAFMRILYSAKANDEVRFAPGGAGRAERSQRAVGDV